MQQEDVRLLDLLAGDADPIDFGEHLARLVSSRQRGFERHG
jgi:hypothetical protein